MNDKINELKTLIDTLETDSPLRKQLEEALAAELKRKAEAEAEAAAKEETAKEEADDDAAEDDDSEDDAGGVFGDLKEKLEGLADNDEFITAAAGFVLGAAAVGLGALAATALKK